MKSSSGAAVILGLVLTLAAVSAGVNLFAQTAGGAAERIRQIDARLMEISAKYADPNTKDRKSLKEEIDRLNDERARLAGQMRKDDRTASDRPASGAGAQDAKSNADLDARIKNLSARWNRETDPEKKKLLWEELRRLHDAKNKGTDPGGEKPSDATAGQLGAIKAATLGDIDSKIKTLADQVYELGIVEDYKKYLEEQARALRAELGMLKGDSSGTGTGVRGETPDIGDRPQPPMDDVARKDRIAEIEAKLGGLNDRLTAIGDPAAQKKTLAAEIDRLAAERKKYEPPTEMPAVNKSGTLQLPPPDAGPLAGIIEDLRKTDPPVPLPEGMDSSIPVGYIFDSERYHGWAISQALAEAQKYKNDPYEAAVRIKLILDGDRGMNSHYDVVTGTLKEIVLPDEYDVAELVVGIFFPKAVLAQKAIGFLGKLSDGQTILGLVRAHVVGEMDKDNAAALDLFKKSYFWDEAQISSAGNEIRREIAAHRTRIAAVNAGLARELELLKNQRPAGDPPFLGGAYVEGRSLEWDIFMRKVQLKNTEAAKAKAVEMAKINSANLRLKALEYRQNARRHKRGE